MAWLVLSCVSLTAQQVTGFAISGLHRFPQAGAPTRATAIGRSSGRSFGSISLRDIISVYNDTFAVSPPDASTFYNPQHFDWVFESCESDPAMSYGDLLSAHGSFVAETWMQDMASRASNPLNAAFYEDVDTIYEDILGPPPDLPDPTRLKLKTPISDLSDEIMSELLIRPTKLAHIKTTASANHMVDMQHYLRASKKLRSSPVIDELDSEKIFPILMDTGCSVSCSGYADDFHGELAYGDFGTVKTADGEAKIEGFGILRWDVIDLDGRRVTVMVPGYYSPTVHLRLLSPQDYCRYHKLPNNQPQFTGCSDWMTMNIKNTENPMCCIGAIIDSGGCLPVIMGELSHRCLSEQAAQLSWGSPHYSFAHTHSHIHFKISLPMTITLID